MESGETFPLVYSSNNCFSGIEQYTEREGECRNGVAERFLKEGNNLSLAFSPCLEVGYIILIVSLAVALIVFALLILFVEPLRKAILPNRGVKRKNETNMKPVLMKINERDEELSVLNQKTKKLNQEMDKLDRRK